MGSHDAVLLTLVDKETQKKLVYVHKKYIYWYIVHILVYYIYQYIHIHILVYCMIIAYPVWVTVGPQPSHLIYEWLVEPQ